MGNARTHAQQAPRASAAHHSRQVAPKSSTAPPVRQHVGSTSHASILNLQRTLGNRQTAALLHAPRDHAHSADSPKQHETSAYGPALHDSDAARATRTGQLLRTLGRSLALN